MPFTAEQFFEVFRRYNVAVWPMQWVLYAAALSAVWIAFRMPRKSRLLGGLLAALWLWMAVAYHWVFFSAINPAATVFGVLFAAEAVLLLVWTRRERDLVIRARATVEGVVGGMFVLYALVAYPLLALALGHRYPAAPTFGLPCPTTIFTFGVLLWVEKPVPRRLLVVPAAWSLLGFSAVRPFGVIEDTGLLVAGIVAVVLLLRRHRSAGPKGTLQRVARSAA